jgi:hypothetical protein
MSISTAQIIYDAYPLDNRRCPVDNPTSLYIAGKAPDNVFRANNINMLKLAEQFHDSFLV